MNSSRFSKLLLVFVVLVASAGAAGAVTISGEDTPSEVEVGVRVTATYVFTELYQDPQYLQWELQGTTELESVTWTVQLIDLAGNVQDQVSYDGSTFNQSVNKEDDVSEVRVQLTGAAPPIGNYSYEEGHSFLFARFDLARQGGTSTVIDTFTATRHTEESKQAREAIDSAAAAIEDVGGHQQAETTLQNAISAYDAGNFDNAIDLANQAKATATQAKQQNQTKRLMLYVVAAIIVIAGVIGGLYWYRNQQGTSKL